MTGVTGWRFGHAILHVGSRCEAPQISSYFWVVITSRTTRELFVSKVMLTFTGGFTVDGTTD